MLSDFRFIVRSLGRRPGFVLVTVMTLALGIGSAAAIFSVTDWILFRATRISDDVYLVGGQDNQHRAKVARMDFQVKAYEAGTSAFVAFEKAAYMEGNVVVEGKPVATGWLGVTPGLLPMLGVRPVVGRGFLAGEVVLGRDQVAIVSHRFWQTNLGGREDVLGCKIVIGEAVCTVIGVLRGGQTLPAYFTAEVFRPLAYVVDPKRPWLPSLNVLVRTKPGVTRAQAEAALQSVTVDVPENIRQWVTGDRPALSSIAEINAPFRPEVYGVILGAVGFLYAIACLNASNLILIRLLSQGRELTIRLAMGAGRWRVIRLLAFESCILAFLGALGGALVDKWFFPLLLEGVGSPGTSLDWVHWELGGREVAAMGILTLVASGVIVSVPAVRLLRVEIYAGLKDGGAALGESPGLRRLRDTFVVLQTAFAVILLVGAGVMIRTFDRLRHVDLGFDPTGKVKVAMGFPLDYPVKNRLERLYEIEAVLRRLPGVRAAGFGGDLLLPGYYFPGDNMEGPHGSVVTTANSGFSVDFPKAAGLTLKRGQWLNQTMTNTVMVNESLARALWPGQDPVGQLLRRTGGNRNAPPGWKGWVVAGVVGDVRATVRDTPGNYIYEPEGWISASFNTFVLQLSRDYDEGFAGTIRQKLFELDPRMVVHQVVPMDRIREDQLWAERMAAAILKVLAVVATLLTVVGMFSALAYTVDRRRDEFGVRLALGATSRDLIRLALGRGVALTICGIAAGLGGACLLTHLLRSILFETSPTDPAVLGTVAAMVLVTSMLACAWPAVRASRVDVSRLLRSE